MSSLYLGGIVCLGASISYGQSETDNALLHKFRNPPRECRPETWYHFLGGAVTREGIDQDVEAINKAGFSALHFFTIDSCSQIRDRMTTPQVPILSKEWQENLTTLAKGIKKSNTDLVLHSCPGWATAGGPWTNIRNSMRTVTWSETIVEGPKMLELRLPSPPLDDRTFPSAQASSRGEGADYRDIAVLAFPTPKGAEIAGEDIGASQAEQPFKIVGEEANCPYQKLFNGKQLDSIQFPETLELQLQAESPQIIRSVFLTARWFSRLLNPDGYLRMSLFTSDDGEHWKPLTVLELPHGCWQTKQCPFVFSIPQTRSAHIKIVIKWDVGEGHTLLEKPKLAEIRFSSRAQLQAWPALAGYGYRNTPKHPIAGGGPGNWVDPANIIDLTDKMQPDGTLRWQAPAGKWTLLRIGHRYNGRKNQPVVQGGSGPEIDKMDAEATRQHFQAYVGKMAGPGGILEGLVKGQLLESWECRQQNWTEKFPAHFKQHHNYEIRNWLPALAGYIVNSPDQSWAFLCDFRETIDRLICEQFYGEMTRMGHLYGLKTYSEESSGDVIPGDPLRHYRYVDIPMTEYWFRGYDDFGNLTVRGCDDFFKPIKNAVSAYRLYGKDKVAAESHTEFGVQWDEHPFMVKTRTDALFAKGINGVVFHTYAHNPLTDKPGHPMNVSIGFPLNRYQTWWPYMSVWNDYHARSQFLLRQGVAVADVLAYVGDDVIRIDDFERLEGLEHGHDFDWINRELLEQVKVEKGSLIIPTGARYRMLYLYPGHSLHASTLELISNLVEQGMTLVGCQTTQLSTLNPKENAQHKMASLVKKIWGAKAGSPLFEQQGVHVLGSGKVLWGMSLEEALADNHVLPAVETVSSDVPLAWQQRLIDGRDIFYLANTVPYARRLVVNVRSSQSNPMIFQALDGSVRRPVAGQKLPDGRTRLALDFAAAGSLFLLFNPEEPDLKMPASIQSQLSKLLEPKQCDTKVSVHTPMAIPLEWTRRADGSYVKWSDQSLFLKGSWKVTLQSPFEQEKPYTFEMSQLQNLARSDVDHIKYHSGTATYTLTFQCDADWLKNADEVILDLGNVYNIADVTINGRQLAYGLWAPPFRVNVKAALRADDNLLTVKVTNAWYNRLLADAKLKPEERRTWSTVYPTGKLRPAGLVGPVKLLAGANYIELSHETRTYGVELAADKPEFAGFWVDSLARGRKWTNGLLRTSSKQTFLTSSDNGWIRYANSQTGASTLFKFEDNYISIKSLAAGGNAAEHFVLKFRFRGRHPAHATLLGVMEDDGSVKLPAVLHIPGQGTLRITGISAAHTPLSLGYQGSTENATITFPAASKENPRMQFRLEVVSIYPKQAAIESDERFDGYRRCWLNTLQLSSRHRMLANHTGSDVCALCYHQYSEIAMLTGPLADGVSGLQLLRDSLNRILAGKKTYAMQGYEHGKYPQTSLDTWPSLLIAAHNYYQASKDDTWVKANIVKLLQWGHESLKTDSNGNGLIEYHQSGNLGDCKVRPANWWDCINFGYEDAYSNALAYRGFRGLAALAAVAGRNKDAKEFAQAAQKLKDAYYNTFYNPKTGMLVGWKSRDGSLHDYAFTFIQGIAITCGVVDDKDKANKLLDAMFEKMRQVGFHRFDLGLPGNLVNVPAEDYYVKAGSRWGGSNAFQVYENGGASGNHVYYTLAALYKLGRKTEADRILFPILKSFNQCRFQGTSSNDNETNDWHAWDGTPWGYEGLLVDNYLVVKAVLVRQGMVDPEWGTFIKAKMKGTNARGL